MLCVVSVVLCCECCGCCVQTHRDLYLPLAHREVVLVVDKHSLEGITPAGRHALHQKHDCKAT